jgi:CRP/FNR family cyclic AMP-dependent transcriptional regulator
MPFSESVRWGPDGPQGASPAVTDSSLIERALRWSELFSSWPEEVRARLAGLARLRRYGRRTQVLAHDRRARELLCVVSGCLEVGCVDAEGHKFVHGLLGPGHIAPLVRLLEDAPLPYDYHAHEDSVIVHLSCEAVLEVLDSQPSLWREVAGLALQRQRYSLATAHERALGDIAQRLVVTLLRLAALYGHSEPEGLALRVRLSQHDLAAMLGVSRQTINREMGELIAQGVLEATYNRIVIKDLERLQALARWP